MYCFTIRKAAVAVTAVAGLLLAQSAEAGDLRVEVTGLRSSKGALLVAVCTPETFARRTCPHVATAPASAGGATVRNVPPGIWAVQAIHDEDGNGILTRRGVMPDEGMAFSRDAPMRMGPPRFADAAVELGEGGTVKMAMRYFK